jgi:hypothetical protein
MVGGMPEFFDFLRLREAGVVDLGGRQCMPSLLMGDGVEGLMMVFHRPC